MRNLKVVTAPQKVVVMGVPASAAAVPTVGATTVVSSDSMPSISQVFFFTKLTFLKTIYINLYFFFQSMSLGMPQIMSQPITVVSKPVISQVKPDIIIAPPELDDLSHLE